MIIEEEIIDGVTYKKVIYSSAGIITFILILIIWKKRYSLKLNKNSN